MSIKLIYTVAGSKKNKAEGSTSTLRPLDDSEDSADEMEVPSSSIKKATGK